MDEIDMGVAYLIGVNFTPKMDGENNGKSLLKFMIWGYHFFWKHPYMNIW